jgi:hypothetical protein
VRKRVLELEKLIASQDRTANLPPRPEASNSKANPEGSPTRFYKLNSTESDQDDCGSRGSGYNSAQSRRSSGGNPNTELKEIRNMFVQMQQQSSQAEQRQELREESRSQMQTTMMMQMQQQASLDRAAQSEALRAVIAAMPIAPSRARKAAKGEPLESALPLLPPFPFPPPCPTGPPAAKAGGSTAPVDQTSQHAKWTAERPANDPDPEDEGDEDDDEEDDDEDSDEEDDDDEDEDDDEKPSAFFPGNEPPLICEICGGPHSKEDCPVRPRSGKSLLRCLICGGKAHAQST